MDKLTLNRLKSEKGCVGFFGIGRSNLALMKLISKDTPVILRSDAPISKNSLPKGLNIRKICEGADAFSAFEEEILFFSPSVRRERAEFSAAAASGVVFSSDLELFLSENSSMILAVSGSDGKSTTATLAHMMLPKKRDTLLLGNIGTPFSTALLKKNIRLSVCELSSFQLSYAELNAKRAAITNITENHLNWHKDFNEYRDVKLSLLDSTFEKIISADDNILADYGKGKELFAVTSTERSFDELREAFSAEMFFTFDGGYIKKNGEKLISKNDLRQKGEYNIKNAMTALALTEGFTDMENRLKTLREFGGLSHRCQRIFEFRGAEFIDSSIDTSPARTAATLSSLEENIIIILGGKDKGLGYEALRSPLSKHAKLAVICGENREKIAADIRGALDIAVIPDFEDAVLYAIGSAKDKDTVLLSPASASYDAFTSFEARGEKFKEIISKYIKNQEKQ